MELEYRKGCYGDRPNPRSQNASSNSNNTTGFNTIVAPNPSSNGIFMINVNFLNDKGQPEQSTSLQVVDLQGKVLQEYNNIGKSHKINLSLLGKGVYFLKVTNGQKFKVEKVIYH